MLNCGRPVRRLRLVASARRCRPDGSSSSISQPGGSSHASHDLRCWGCWATTGVLIIDVPDRERSEMARLGVELCLFYILYT
eukprot:scaffold11439_cov122-Isochrysis_galbana.AAC.2